MGVSWTSKRTTLSCRSYVTFSEVCKDNTELQDILGFQVQNLPIMYLGLPITGKKKPITNAGSSFDPMKMDWEMLIIWGRIQMVNCIIAGKCKYWAHGTSFPISIVKKVKMLAYQFIWDGRN